MDNTSKNNNPNFSYQIPVGFQEDRLGVALRKQQESELQAAIEAAEKELATTAGLAHGAMHEVSVKTDPETTKPNPPVAEKITPAPTPEYDQTLSSELTEKAPGKVHETGLKISHLRQGSGLTPDDLRQQSKPTRDNFGLAA